MHTVTLHDKTFKKTIVSEQIQKRINELSDQMCNELAQKDVIFVAVLNGAFMFATDVMRRITFPCYISFLKLASYQGSSSTGNIKQLVGLNEDLKGRTAVVLEDIVDTGHTLQSILRQLKGFEPAEIKIATLLYKPRACKHTFDLNYVGFEVPNDFIVGFGLDYNGLGRNLEDIYTIVE